MLDALGPTNSDDVMLGFETSDDAAVVRLSDDLALLQTVDFFTPIVDDPFDFGRIAAANALSDIYAMGGEPLCAMNLLAVPRSMGTSAVADIVRGAAAICARADTPIVGGHTIDDAEPKFGLAVTGRVHPDEVLYNAGARPGDLLVLTKPLGTGLIATAIKQGRLQESEPAARGAIESMAGLNREASRAARALHARACTDVSGFGLAGHAHEMAQASHCAVEITMDALPLLEGAAALAAEGVMPGKTAELITWAADFMVCEVPGAERLVCDPQTSGGLLLALDPSAGEVPGSWVVGRFVEGPAGQVQVR